MKTTLGIVIPVYNVEKYVKEAILSVLSQPCKDMIVVAVNDGSPDDSESIIKDIMKEDDRVFLVNQENRGLSSARNSGIAFLIKKGVDYIAFLDSDDIWVPNIYTSELNKTIREENRDLYQFGNYNSNDDISRLLKIENDEYDESEKPINKHSIHFCAAFYKMELIVRYNLRFYEELKVHEDQAFKYLFRCAAKTYKSFDKYLFVYRSNIDSMLHKKRSRDDDNNFINSVIPAWARVKEDLIRIKSAYPDSGITEEEVIQCDIMKKAFAAECIMDLCEMDFSVKEIDEIIEESSLYSLIDNDLYLAPSHEKFLKDYRNHPGITRCKHRIKAILFGILRSFRNNPIVQKKRYPLLASKEFE